MGALQPLPSLLRLLAVACRMLSCLPAPPCWCWELGLLHCPALARLADGHPWLPGSLSPQQLARQVAAEWGLPARSTACQMDHGAGRDPLLRAGSVQALSIPGLACSPGLLPGAVATWECAWHLPSSGLAGAAWPGVVQQESCELEEPKTKSGTTAPWGLLLHLPGCQRGRDTGVPSPAVRLGGSSGLLEGSGLYGYV